MLAGLANIGRLGPHRFDQWHRPKALSVPGGRARFSRCSRATKESKEDDGNQGDLAALETAKEVAELTQHFALAEAIDQELIAMASGQTKDLDDYETFFRATESSGAPLGSQHPMLEDFGRCSEPIPLWIQVDVTRLHRKASKPFPFTQKSEISRAFSQVSRIFQDCFQDTSGFSEFEAPPLRRTGWLRLSRTCTMNTASKNSVRKLNERHGLQQCTPGVPLE
eukprot:s905_g27.t1